MSRIGKKPVVIPPKAKVELKESRIAVTGPKGTLERLIHPDITVAMQGQELHVSRHSDQKKYRALHGLTRALIHNMLEGVSHGFSKQLQIVGVGFRAELRAKALILYIGYSHPIVFVPPAGINLTVEPKENRITIEGIDKQLVGQTAAKIRSFRVPEPYKGKGIRYVGEQIQIKAGKTAG